ncbi:MAG: tetratricopeptide repeat protein [Tannerellaceae bacterium]|nr:tetratricopeptide repeat protein [Tannerellaceae bacterium]
MEKYISHIRIYHENEAHEQFLNGIQFFKKGQYRQALDAYFTALVILRDYPDIYSSIGRVYHVTGEYSKALEYYKKAIAINPSHPSGWHFVGKAHNDLHNFAEAVEAFTKALECDPKNYMTYLNLSIAYDGMGKPSEASKVLEDLVRLYPDHPISAADSSDEMNAELDKAVRYLREALARQADDNNNPDSPSQSEKDIHWDDLF